MENNVQPTVADPQGEAKETKAQFELPTSMEELQSMLQKEGDKRVTEARKKIEADFNDKLEKEKNEAARLAKLSKAEKEAEQFNAQRAEFEKQKAEFEKSQLLNQTMKNLQQENLPIDFADYLMADSAEAINENIKIFKVKWQEAIQKEVDNRLVTKTPKTGTSKAVSGVSFFDAINQSKIR